MASTPTDDMARPSFEMLLEGAKIENSRGRGAVNCTYTLAAQDKPYPRTCQRCGLGPCPFTASLLAARDSPTDDREVVKVTRLPWIAAPAGRQMRENYNQSYAIGHFPTSMLVAGCFSDTLGGEATAEANARLIVTAVNHHQALVDALRTARGQIVGFSIPEIGPDAAVKNVEYIDTLLSQIGAA